MFDKTIATVKGWLTKMGILTQLKTIKEHKDVNVDDDAYKRIAKNKAIYSGHLSEWHDIEFRTSAGVNKKRKMFSMGMGKKIAEEMATLIFNEKATITIDDAIAQEFIDDTLKSNGFHKNFSRYLEYAYATGGMAVKVFAYDGQVKLAYAVADAFYPLSSDSENIDEALFISEETKGDKYYTLLEWNEWEGNQYVVTNELYQSTVEGELGIKVGLAALYPDLEEKVYINELRRSLFVYFKPNIANNKDMTSPLGISLFENCYDDLYLLDYMYDFFFNEFKLGKRRIAVDRSMIKAYPDANGNMVQVLDPEETVYDAFTLEDGKGVTDMSVDIRSTDIINSINSILDVLSMKVGFNPGSFRFDGTGIKTATEVVSQNSKTYQTKNKHEVLIEEGIKELITSIIDVAILYDLYSGEKEFEIGIDFDDSIAQDRQENFNYYSAGVGAGMIPKLIAIQKTYDVPEKTAQEWLDMIAAEQPGTVTPESADLFGTGATNVGE
ncbi:phage portal protein [Carnobacterium pleistocenium]|uniref:phage portal protein n=1 Tax=Carnobacterium pleistocenium TaxID=181073 RepID=UPI00054FEF4D|nr:phage portal protein [Carnobacterium pleistocenium]